MRPELRLLRLKAPFDEIANPRITDLRTGQTVEIPVRMRADDRLLVEGSTVLLNGIPVLGGIETPLPEVPTLGSEWRFDADVVVPGTEAGKEKGAFPVARFDRSVGNNRGTFGSMVLAPSEPVVTLDVSSYKPKPGVFTVVIPWHIPGFTDKFEERDHPRQQIPSLVERVKAAGVRALVAYKMVFAEQHDVHGVLRLGLGGRLFAHDQDARDAMRMESSQSTREVHSVQDELILSGSLDYTSFDSLNTFA